MLRGRPRAEPGAGTRSERYLYLVGRGRCQSYGLQAGVASGNYLVALGVGNTTIYSTSAPAVGTYFVRIVALDASGAAIPGGASNEISFEVVSMFLPPAAPTDLRPT